MAEAKKCDRCKTLYELPTDDEMPFNVHERNNNDPLDICPDCKYDIEDWMNNPKRFPKGRKRKKHDLSDEAREKMSARGQEVTTLAKKLQSGSDNMEWGEAIRESNKRLKEPKATGTVCKICERVKVKKAGATCKYCDDMKKLYG